MISRQRTCICSKHYDIHKIKCNSNNTWTRQPNTDRGVAYNSCQYLTGNILGITIVNKSTWRALTSAKVNAARMWNPEPNCGSESEWIPKLNRDFLGQRYYIVKIFMKIRSAFPEIWAKLWKNALSRNVEESLKQFLDTDPDAGDL